MSYVDMREEIHEILCDFLNHERPIQNEGEFDFEYLESCTDDIINLMRKKNEEE